MLLNLKYCLKRRPQPPRKPLIMLPVVRGRREGLHNSSAGRLVMLMSSGVQWHFTAKERPLCAQWDEPSSPKPSQVTFTYFVLLIYGCRLDSSLFNVCEIALLVLDNTDIGQQQASWFTNMKLRMGCVHARRLSSPFLFICGRSDLPIQPLITNLDLSSGVHTS